MTSGKIKFLQITKKTKKWERDFNNFYKGCFLPPHIKDSDAVYFAAYFGNIMVGHSAIRKSNEKWILEGLRVIPQFREMGIGKKLTEMRISYAISQKAENIWYMDIDKNLVSLCCHMKFGFIKTKEKPDSKIKDAIWYKLDLTPQNIEKIKRLSI